MKTRRNQNRVKQSITDQPLFCHHYRQKKNKTPNVNWELKSFLFFCFSERSKINAYACQSNRRQIYELAARSSAASACHSNDCHIALLFPPSPLSAFALCAWHHQLPPQPQPQPWWNEPGRQGLGQAWARAGAIQESSALWAERERVHRWAAHAATGQQASVMFRPTPSHCLVQIRQENKQQQRRDTKDLSGRKKTFVEHLCKPKNRSTALAFLLHLLLFLIFLLEWWDVVDRVMRF